MHQALLKAAAWAIGMLACALCVAQDADDLRAGSSTSPKVGTEPGAAEGNPSQDCHPIAEGTPVLLELLDPVGSAKVKRGDKFRLRLSEDVISDGRVVVPAGTDGMGEVIHANPSRGGGKPGELLLAARHLDYQGRAIALRGLKLGGRGKDTSGAALAAAAGIGPFALFIHGKEIEIPAGTQATAKLAQVVSPPPTSCLANTPQLQAASDPTAVVPPSSESDTGPAISPPHQQQE